MDTSGDSDAHPGDGSFSWFETTVNGGVAILSLLRDAAAVAPVPYLKQAAGIVVDIIGIIQSVKDNKSDFRRLGQDAAALVIGVIESYEKSENKDDWPGKRLQGALDNLINILLSIELFTQKQLRRGLFIRILNYISDGRTIKEYRERLTEATSRFGLSAQLEASELLRKLDSRMDNLVLNQQQQNPMKQGSLEEPKRKAHLKSERESQRSSADEKDSHHHQHHDSQPKRQSKDKHRRSESSHSSPPLSPDRQSAQQWHGPQSPPSNYGPQYTPWSQGPPFVGMPMPTMYPAGGPVYTTNINSGNVTTITKSNVGNNNSTTIIKKTVVSRNQTDGSDSE